MLFFNKAPQSNFIEYLFLVKGIRYYRDNSGNITSQEETVFVRYLPHENYYGVVKRNEKDGKAIIINKSTNLSLILNNIEPDTYLINKEDLNFTNYTTYAKFDELSPSKSKKKLFNRAA